MTTYSPVSNIPQYTTETVINKEGSANADQLQVDFLRMLTAQLEYQDPLEPLENTEFTAQMAQFSSLGEQQTTNALLERLLTSQSGDQVNQAVSFIGKRVFVEGENVSIEEGEGTLRFELSQAASALIKIQDEAGQTVKEIQSRAYSAGENSVDINDPAFGAALEDGQYTFSVVLEDGGSDVEVIQMESGVVTGVSRDSALGVLLDLNGRQRPLDAILRVEQENT